MNDSRWAIIDIINDALKTDDLSYDDLRAISAHIHDCGKELTRKQGAMIASQITAGSSVRIRHDANLSPRYVLGVMAKVIRVNKTTAAIELGHVPSPNDRSKFYTGQTINCPLNALEIFEG